MARIKKSGTSRPRCWFKRQPFPTSPSPNRHSSLPTISIPRSSSTRPQLFSAVKLPICRCLFIRHLEGCLRHDAHILRMHKDHPDPPASLRRSKVDCNCASAFGPKEESSGDGDELYFPDLVMKEKRKPKRRGRQPMALDGRICTTVSWSPPTSGSDESEYPMVKEEPDSGKLQAGIDFSLLDRNNGRSSPDADWRILLADIEASDGGEGFERSSDEITNGGSWGLYDSGDEIPDGGEVFRDGDDESSDGDKDKGPDEGSSGKSTSDEDHSESSSEDNQEHRQVRLGHVTTTTKSSTFTNRAAAGQKGGPSGSSRHSGHGFTMGGEPGGQDEDEDEDDNNGGDMDNHPNQQRGHHHYPHNHRTLWSSNSNWERPRAIVG